MSSVLAATQAAAYLRNESAQVARFQASRLAPPWRRALTACLRGWQRTAAHACDERTLEMASFCSHTSLSSPAAFTGRAPLRTGPHGSAYLRGCIRWTGMLAVAAQRAVAYSLLELPLAAADECDGTQPPLGDLFVDARDTEPVPASRLPAPC